MGLLNKFLSNTVGVLYRAGSGTVDPWTNAEANEELQKGIVRAGGNTNAANAAVRERENYLKSLNAHPDQALSRLAEPLEKLKKSIGPILLAVGAVFLLINLVPLFLGRRR